MDSPFGDAPILQPDEAAPSSPPPTEANPFGDRPVTDVRPKPSATDNIIAAQDTNPDEAAKGLKLSKNLNLPASIIGLDPERYNADATRRSALDIVEKNDAIKTWMEKDSNNAKISHDDLTVLDRLVNNVKQLPLFSPIRNAKFYGEDISHFFSEGLDTAFDFGRSRPLEDDQLRKEMVEFLTEKPDLLGNKLTPEAAKKAAEDQIMRIRRLRAMQGPLFGSVEAVMSPLLAAYRTFFSRPLEEAKGFPKEATEGLTMAAAGLIGIRNQPRFRGTPEILPPETGFKVERPPLLEPPGPTIDLGRGEYKEAPKQGFPTDATVEPYIPPLSSHAETAMREGETPRPGTDFLADKVHIEEAAANRDSFQSALELAQESKLRERSPEALASLLRQVIGDRSIYLPAAAVEAFYRDVHPHADDNILGWLDNAEKKVSASLALGTDLQIPMAQALAHMDPAVWAKVKDQARFAEVGVNADEAKVLKEAEPEHYAIDTVAPDEIVKDLDKRQPELFTPKETGPMVEGEGLAPFGAMSKIKVVSEFNKERTLALMGESRYEKMYELASVTMKELLQNSFDAIKDKKTTGGKKYNGKIEITMDKNTRTVTVHDNGIGMDAKLMAKDFWTIAGSQKASEDNSGGFGISKALWQHSNVGLRVYTLKNGVFTTVKTDGKTVRESFSNPDLLEIDSDIATAENAKMFPDGHGTRIEVDIPTQYRRNGELRDFSFDDYSRSHPGLLYSPLFNDIEVKFNKQVMNIGKNFPVDQFTQFANVKFDWGNVRIYVTKGDVTAYQPQNLHVLSNGIWQFSKRLSNNPKDEYAELIPKTFYVDVKPTVDATDSEYPFDMNRQRFSTSVSEDFGKIFRYMQALYQQADLHAMSRNFGDISYIENKNGKFVQTEKRPLEPPLPPRDTVVTGIKEGDSVTVKDGKLIVNGREIPELTSEQLEATHIDLDELRVPQDEIDPNRVMLHDSMEVDRPKATIPGDESSKFVQVQSPNDQTMVGPFDSVESARDWIVKNGDKYGNADLYIRSKNTVEGDFKAFGEVPIEDPDPFRQQPFPGTGDRVSLVEAAHAQFGERFYEYVHFLGKTFMDLRDFVAEELDSPKLKKEAVGLSFDQKYYGVNITIPFTGAFLNPGMAAHTSPRRAGLDMIHTMVHELAHHTVRSHGVAFEAQMQDIQVYLEEARLYNSERYDIGKVAASVVAHMEKHNDIFTWLSQQIKSGSPSTRGKRLKGAESSGGSGGLPPDVGGDKQPRGEGDAKPPEEGGTGSTRPDGDTEERGPAGEDGDILEGADLAQGTPREQAEREAADRGGVETDLTKAVRRERRALYLDPLFKDPKSAGMDAVQFGRYSRKIAMADQEAYEKAVEKAKGIVKKRLTEEWKRDREQVKAEVETDFKSSPMVVADRYIRLGELPTGEIVERQKLDADTVQALGGQGLDRYTVKRGGVHPDDLAPALQFETGKQLVDSLNSFEKGRAAWDESKGPKAYVDHLVNQETDERMERRFGSLQGKILEEARDLITTASHLDILTDEMKQLAQMAGLPFEKETIPRHVEDIFRQEVAQEVSYERFRKAAESNAKVAEKALLKSGFREAFQAKQRQYAAVLMAREARAFDKKMATAERQFRKIVRQDSRGGIEQDHFDNVKKILHDAGFTEKTGQEPLKDLPTLINESGGAIAAASWITDPSTKRAGMEYKNFTVEEFNALRDTVRSVLHVGGDAKKIDSVHGQADRDNVIVDIRRNLERFGVRPPWEKQSYVRRAGSLANYITAAHALVERLFDYSDKFDPNGPITRFVDRPLRDGFNKELELAEQVVARLKKLEQFTDKSVNDYINNKYITDPIDKTLHPMTRKNLRMIMLHMGSDSGIEKITGGYNIDIISAFNLIRENAKKEDFAWVNGMHEIFDFLWKPASEMQRRYTGVEADPIVPRPYKMKLSDGMEAESKGGYAPLFYDKTRTNLEGDLSLKSDLFDKNYVAAVPAHRYTIARTKYQGWVDMEGTLLSSRINQMIHDIAFREPVRNAQKLISDKEFMLAMNQYWGPQYASLLSGWLRDIANVHNVDDQFAQGAARFLSVMRQNVVRTLVNMNPGTMLKHGLTALSMSKALTTTGALAGAFKDLGITAILQSAKDLMTSEKGSLTPEERANLVAVMKDPATREFIINSSPLFRNRSRSYPDTIRGAFERASEAGPMQTVRNLQSISDRVGRFGVALSDMASAMPMWLAAYKDAIARTGDHADAVFEADRVTARAHGSSFYGDKPAVSRIANTVPGELTKSFVSLYNFWNHMFNNELQLAWDAQARGTRGAGSEPGADFGKIIERIILYAVIPIMIEEMASPALSDDKESLGHKMFSATLRYFGGMFVGLREVTNAWASGYEPSMGMVGTFVKTMDEAKKDLMASRARKSWITHAFSALGMFGVPFANTQTGRVVQGAEKQLTGQERPRTLEEYRALYRKGYIHSGRR